MWVHVVRLWGVSTAVIDAHMVVNRQIHASLITFPDASLVAEHGLTSEL